MDIWRGAVGRGGWAALGVVGVVSGIFFAIDFVWKHPSTYRGGPDVALSGDSRWVLPSADDMNEGDVRYVARGGEDLISGILSRDIGNYVFVRVELTNDLQLARGEGKDLVLVFSWGEGGSNSPLPGLPVDIGVSGGWSGALIVRDNAGSSLWGGAAGEIAPTHVERTYFDSGQATITVVLSKLLFISTGWDGVEPVSTTAVVLRDGGNRLKDFEAMGRIRPNGWGRGGWTWEPEWIKVVDPERP